MLSIKLIGAEKLSKKLKPETITKPLSEGLKKITLSLEGLTKKATVVDTGRLRSSIVSEVAAEFGKVATNVSYAEAVEFGTAKMEARHMEGGTKVFGIGMFAYGLKQLKGKMGNLLKGIGIAIEKRFNK